MLGTESISLFMSAIKKKNLNGGYRARIMNFIASIQIWPPLRGGFLLHPLVMGGLKNSAHRVFHHRVNSSEEKLWLPYFLPKPSSSPAFSTVFALCRFRRLQPLSLQILSVLYLPWPVVGAGGLRIKGLIAWARHPFIHRENALDATVQTETIGIESHHYIDSLCISPPGREKSFEKDHNSDET